ncbi:glycoside hydrolase family 3 N-terminal domain-containing protein [Opitutus sp. GAS368]|uniref:glycoside hydrolase family 3 N-terminal domain-containing protein n=1 Tax=Opitutus sp. GAS368 TaxID=1882749 RepID=UPI000B890CF6|nr:glycoside hydrolase family 3 N-terminal domain-containing protein [Opitutus sp. GAS368]
MTSKAQRKIETASSCFIQLVLASVAGWVAFCPTGAAGGEVTASAELVANMALEEKIAQIHSVVGNTSGLYPIRVFSDEVAEPVLGNGAGWVWRVTTYLDAEAAAKSANTLQRKLKNETRSGIPALVVEEGLHGLMAKGATSFPQAIALASSWDPELLERVFTAVALEARARGANWLLTPVLDVARDPRWGRTEETYGEDPYLVSRMGVAAIFGLQGRGPGIGKDHVLATAKHFAAHGQPEGGTNRGPGNYSERILREQFFPPFEAAVREAHVGAVMASYNEIDGVPSHANRKLLQGLLRDEWGFTGLICADDNGVAQLETLHHVAADPVDAARQAFQAGVDLELSDDHGTFGSLAEQVSSGAVSPQRIDEAVTRILKAKQALGLFAQPLVDPARAKAVTNAPEHRRLALEAARKSIVLLKNAGGLLPLNLGKIRTVAVLGPNAAAVHVGGYSYAPAEGVSVLEGIRRKVGGQAAVRYAEGCRITDAVQGWEAWWTDEASKPPVATEETARIAEAVEQARGADVAVIVIGENEGVCREAWSQQHLGDRDSLALLGRQEELVKAVAATGVPTVVILINGRPLAAGGMVEAAAGVLEGFYLGQETGTAVADVLFGDFNPGGKLPITFPKNVGQLPAYYYHKPSVDRDYLYSPREPLFPFGFGLSYTTFEFGLPRISPAQIPRDGTATVTVEIRNSGDRIGDEVVQLYVHQRVASVTRPVRQLRGFRRITLAPGERREVQFQLGRAELAFYNRAMALGMEPGFVDIHLGNGSGIERQAVLEVVQ